MSEFAPVPDYPGRVATLFPQNVDNVIILPHQEPPPQKSRGSSDSTGSGDSGGGDGDGCLTEEAGDADGAIDAFG